VKETESYLEKDRTFRNRSKKRRGELPVENYPGEGIKPQHVPYKRRKDWMQLPMVDEDDEEQD
jgi:hypothetical protein